MKKQIYIPKVTGDVFIKVTAQLIEEPEIPIEPEEPVTPPVNVSTKGYSISYNVSSRATINNFTTTIIEHGKYTAIVTPKKGYVLSQVKVLMNNIDISNNALLAPNQINIPDVTGNIQIIVTTTEAAESVVVQCSSLILNKNNLTFNNNNTQTIIASILPNNCTRPLSWDSNDTKIAAVHNGVVIPINNGTTTINARCGDKVATCNVTVNIKEKNVAITYDNPTITMSGIKAKVEKNDYIQYFDLSIAENVNHPKYAGSITLTDSKGIKHYLMLSETGSSPFGKNGLHLESKGWFSLTDGYGQEYSPLPSILGMSNGNGNLTVKTIGVNNAVMEKSLDYFNQTLPVLNMTIDGNSKNTITQGRYGDSWLGYESTDPSNFFEIQINEEVLIAQHGPCDVNNINWIDTIVHELGHALGANDFSMHTPSMYSTTTTEFVTGYIQPNDIAFLEYAHKILYGIDITTNQENINAQATAVNLNYDLEYATNYNMKRTESFTFTSDDFENSADSIIISELEYVNNEVFNVSRDINNPCCIEYKIYNVKDNDLQLKVPASLNISFEENQLYKLYLKLYDDLPCSLINPYLGFEKI